MVSQPFQLPGSLIGTIKVIIRIIHTISTEHGFQTPLIKGFVMRNQRKPLYFRSNLLPYFRKNRSMGSIFLCQSMNTGVPIQIVIRFGMNEAVEPVGYLTILTITTPTLHMLVRSLFAVSKSIAAKLSILFFVTQTKVRQKSDIQNSFFRYNSLSLKPQQQNRPISMTISTCES